MSSLPQLLQATDELSALMAQRPATQAETLAQDLARVAQAQHLDATAEECRLAAQRVLAPKAAPIPDATPASTVPSGGLSPLHVGGLQLGGGALILALARFMLHQPVLPTPPRPAGAMNLEQAAALYSAKMSQNAHDMGYLGLMVGAVLVMLGCFTLWSWFQRKSTS